MTLRLSGDQSGRIGAYVTRKRGEHIGACKSRWNQFVACDGWEEVRGDHKSKMRALDDAK
jgi:hypothetical protein